LQYPHKEILMTRTATVLLGLAAFCLTATAQAHVGAPDCGTLRTHLKDCGTLRTHLKDCGTLRTHLKDCGTLRTHLQEARGAML
jgi:hypothetical protein